MQRRNFIKSTTAAGLTIATTPTILAGNRWRGANDRVNVAVIGIRGMGQSHIQSYQKAYPIIAYENLAGQYIELQYQFSK